MDTMDPVLAIKVDWKSRVQITLSRGDLLWIETCLITANIGYKHHDARGAIKKTDRILKKLDKVIRSENVKETDI